MKLLKFAFSYILKENFIYTIGGRSIGGDDQAIVPYCEKYDIKNNEWI